MWAFAALLVAGAAWGARWSPTIVDLSISGRPELTVSVAGAVEVASTQIATGLGVALAAFFSAAGPGRDFVDGSAELRRTSGSPAQRFATRVVAVTLLIVACGAGIACLAIVNGLLTSARNDVALDLQLGSWNLPRVFIGVVVAAAHSIWVLAVAQRVRTHASQLALPIALAIAMFLISRLSPYPVTPDSWLGPILGLKAERAMLDFWWSVGGGVSAPRGNAALLMGVMVIATALGIQADTPGRATALPR